MVVLSKTSKATTQEVPNEKLLSSTLFIAGVRSCFISRLRGAGGTDGSVPARNRAGGGQRRHLQRPRPGHAPTCTAGLRHSAASSRSAEERSDGYGNQKAGQAISQEPG